MRIDSNTIGAGGATPPATVKVWDPLVRIFQWSLVASFVVALLIALAGTCATGYMMTTDAYWGSRLVEHIHEFLASLTVGLVVAHVLGVLIASLARTWSRP